MQMTKWRWPRRHIIYRNSCQMPTYYHACAPVCANSLLSFLYVSGVSPNYAQTMVSWMRVNRETHQAGENLPVTLVSGDPSADGLLL